jgi:hypothetical protein
MCAVQYTTSRSTKVLLLSETEECSNRVGFYRMTQKSLCACKKCSEPVHVLCWMWKVVQEVSHIRLMRRMCGTSVTYSQAHGGHFQHLL